MYTKPRKNLIIPYCFLKEHNKSKLIFIKLNRPLISSFYNIDISHDIFLWERKFSHLTVNLTSKLRY